MSMMEYSNPGSARIADVERDVCESALMELLSEWPEVPDDTLSSGLLDHVLHCRTCLTRLIAMDAAIDLAELTAASDQP